MQARGTHSSRIESIPRMTALAEPVVLFAGRPAAQGTTDTRTGRFPIPVEIAVWNDSFVGNGIHSAETAQRRSHEVSTVHPRSAR